MTSVKVKFRPSTVAGHEGTIFYQLIHQKGVRQLSTSYKLKATEWDARRSSVVIPQTDIQHQQAQYIREAINSDLKLLARIDRKMEAKGLPYSADDVADEYRRYKHDYSLFRFMESIIEKLRHNNKIRTSEAYKSALASFRHFRNDINIMLTDITAEIMQEYEAWLKSRGVVANTISFYARILRAVYNRAVDHDIVDDCRPFRHIYTGIGKTVKRALPLSIIAKIKRLKLPKQPNLDYARDMFIMSFYLRGMSFVDMTFLKKSDLKNGFITYRRRKTGQRLVIKWTKEMQTLLDKYPENESDYLLPIIRKRTGNEWYTYRNMGYFINNNLKKVAERVGITIPLTMYVARHSWASAAKAKGIPLTVISEGMGHDSESTTRIYLAALDTSVVDNANSLILSSL